MGSAAPTGVVGRVADRRRAAVAGIGGDPIAIAPDSVTVARLAALVLHGRRSGEPLTLIVGNQLVIGEPLLVHLGALLTDLRRRSFAGGLLLGDARAPFGDLGALIEPFGFLAVAPGNLLASLSELPLARPDPGAFTDPWQRHRERPVF